VYLTYISNCDSRRQDYQSTGLTGRQVRMCPSPWGGRVAERLDSTSRTSTIVRAKTSRVRLLLHSSRSRITRALARSLAERATGSLGTASLFSHATWLTTTAPHFRPRPHAWQRTCRAERRRQDLRRRASEPCSSATPRKMPLRLSVSALVWQSPWKLARGAIAVPQPVAVALRKVASGRHAPRVKSRCYGRALFSAAPRGIDRRLRPSDTAR
jgi:hypothetical protein